MKVRVNSRRHPGLLRRQQQMTSASFRSRAPIDKLDLTAQRSRNRKNVWQSRNTATPRGGACWAQRSWPGYHDHEWEEELDNPASHAQAFHLACAHSHSYTLAYLDAARLEPFVRSDYALRFP